MRLLAVLALCCAAPSPAAAGEVRFSGHLKELWQYSRSALDGRPYFLNTDRARLTLEGRAAGFKAHVDYDHEVSAGSQFRTTERRLYGTGEPASWLDMEQTVSTSATSLWRHRLYRGWVGWEDAQTAVRFGRQRVAWGTGKIWNPTDVLNPYQPLAVEREERRGVDALYARRGLGELSQAELAWAPREDWTASALLARAKSNWRGWDVSVAGGKVQGSTASWMAGGDFARDLFEGQLRGEWSYTATDERRPYWRGLVGYEYTFGSGSPRPFRDATVLAEYYHNGRGTVAPSRYDRAVLLTGRETALAKDYAGATFSQDVHPLLKLEAVALANLDDGSTFLAPSLQYNALSDLYLTAGWQRFGSSRDTEFGRQPNLAFLQAQYFF